MRWTLPQLLVVPGVPVFVGFSSTIYIKRSVDLVLWSPWGSRVAGLAVSGDAVREEQRGGWPLSVNAVHQGARLPSRGRDPTRSEWASVGDAVRVGMRPGCGPKRGHDGCVLHEEWHTKA